jgi:hypothetical protein
METKTHEAPDPQADQKKAPGREKQPEGSKRLTVMNHGVPAGIEVQPGTMTSDVMAQLSAKGKLSNTPGGSGRAFGATEKLFDLVNDQDTLYITG